MIFLSRNNIFDVKIIQSTTVFKANRSKRRVAYFFKEVSPSWYMVLDIS